MKLLVHGRFYPSVGGIETVLRLLAAEWQRSGEDVVIASDVVCKRPEPERFPFRVYYQPTGRQWLRLICWADVFVHMNLSLKALWPWLLMPKPLILVHHGFYYADHIRGSRDWKERLKLRLLSKATNIAVSMAVASKLPVPCEVIGNPFDDSLFSSFNQGQRERELIFVGRLVSEKGVDLLLRALGELRDHGLRPRLTIVGEGPERIPMEHLSARLDLAEQVVFKGECAAEEVATELQQHVVAVIPSICEEAYGVVALEALACGCVVLTTRDSGLLEATGSSGLTFRRGDQGDLVAKLRRVLLNKDEFASCRSGVRAHLERHRAANVAQKYLWVFRQAAIRCGLGAKRKAA
jgi:glycosyltransferase involved in cell wall biosynthesis